MKPRDSFFTCARYNRRLRDLIIVNISIWGSVAIVAAIVVRVWL